MQSFKIDIILFFCLIINSAKSLESAKSDLATAKSICTKEINFGSCGELSRRWAFVPEQLSCVLFYHGFCRGSTPVLPRDNNFKSKKECESTCAIVRAALTEERSREVIHSPTDLTTAKSICTEKIYIGPCSDEFPSWAFYDKGLYCVPFTYGGCYGNRNKFSTKEQCESTCAIVKAALTEERSRLFKYFPTDLATAKSICTKEIEVGPCSGNFTSWAFYDKGLSCVSFTYGGCYGNSNNFKSKKECESTCAIVKAALTEERSRQFKYSPTDLATAKSICTEKIEIGPCSDNFTSWAFYDKGLLCVPFTYGGCDGNRNNFKSKGECESTCAIVKAALTEERSRQVIHPPFDLATAKSICTEKIKIGPCSNKFPSWAFYAKELYCVPFTYSGCYGNRNNFKSKEECESTCAIVKAALTEERYGQVIHPLTDLATAKSICTEKIKIGPCSGNFTSWAFYDKGLLCVPFRYGGCYGNSNNFKSKEECESTCEIVKAALTEERSRQFKYSPTELATAKSICTEKIKIGPCSGNSTSWTFYDKGLFCVPIRYGGCYGNSNNFKSKEQCESTCAIVKAALTEERSREVIHSPTLATAKSICTEKIEIGSCLGNFTSWAFYPKGLFCVPFRYGGCHGNSNNFKSKEQCESTCGIFKAALTEERSRQVIHPPFDLATAKSICMEKISRQRCYDDDPVWHFDAKRLTCRRRYGVCDISDRKRNKFATRKECERTCDIVEVALMEERSFNKSQSRVVIDRPINCMMSAWSPWSQCNATCGKGSITRHRTIMRQPKNGGRPCPRKLQQHRKCQSAPCY